jgi:hypothetical protein
MLIPPLKLGMSHFSLKKICEQLITMESSNTNNFGIEIVPRAFPCVSVSIMTNIVTLVSIERELLERQFYIDAAILCTLALIWLLELG